MEAYATHIHHLQPTPHAEKLSDWRSGSSPPSPRGRGHKPGEGGFLRASLRLGGLMALGGCLLSGGTAWAQLADKKSHHPGGSQDTGGRG